MQSIWLRGRTDLQTVAGERDPCAAVWPFLCVYMQKRTGAVVYVVALAMYSSVAKVISNKSSARTRTSCWEKNWIKSRLFLGELLEVCWAAAAAVAGPRGRPVLPWER